MHRLVSGLIVGLVAGALSYGLSAQAPADGPEFSGDQVMRPAGYREWVYLTSGLGMTYGPAQPASNQPSLFDNVFVSPAAYREFLRSGTWPDGTMLVLELRRADANVSINNGGRTQGDVVAIEAAVKDRQRYPNGGWAYFTFGGPKGADRAAPLAQTASCYACHTKNAAVENTFVQFYPTLFEVARQKNTIRSDYDPQRKP
jgi:cytochrome P460